MGSIHYIVDIDAVEKVQRMDIAANFHCGNLKRTSDATYRNIHTGTCSLGNLAREASPTQTQYTGYAVQIVGVRYKQIDH